VGNRLAVVVALIIATLIAAVAPAAAADRYVGLGDSFAAGPLIPVQIRPFGCLKSNNNYVHIVQRQKAFAEFRDPSCSGAETEDMTQPQNVSPRPNPPQFDSLSTDTVAVTLTISGNDIGFSGIAEDCFSPTPSSGSPCKDQYTAGGQDEISRRIAETAPKVDAVLDGIRARSPESTVFVVNYSALFPHEGPGCWPQMPVAEGDVPYLREKQEELNAMLADQAAANGARLVDVYAASVGHDACAPPLLRWVEPYVPASAAAPLHPNLFGMRAFAHLVLREMAAAGV
jgi:GDSL-like lipase/acylhydrolase family protein